MMAAILRQITGRHFPWFTRVFAASRICARGRKLDLLIGWVVLTEPFRDSDIRKVGLGGVSVRELYRQLRVLKSELTAKL